jgi:sugar-phosphatase
VVVRLEIEAILFDNDGVLIDSRGKVEAAWVQLAREFDLPVDRLLSELAGVRASDTLGRYLGPDLLERAVSRLEDIEVSLAADTRSMAGARELIEQLPTGSWTIVTLASRRLANARWNGAGLAVPEIVVTAEDVVAGKPNPEPFQKAAALLGSVPDRCIAFEDSPSGALAARAAGVPVIAVGDQTWPVDPLVRIPDLTSVAISSASPGPGLELVIDPPSESLHR